MSIYRVYTNECINIIMSLNHILPLELIQVIIRLYWNLHSYPVLLSPTTKSVLISLTPKINKPDASGHVINTRSKEYNDISKILKLNPNLRHYPIYDPKFFTPIGGESSWCLVESDEPIPKAINPWISWLSMLYLVPGPLWDYAILYPDSEVNTDSIQSCNGFSKNEIIPALGKYDTTNPDDILRWFNDSVNHPDFIAVQNTSL